MWPISPCNTITGSETKSFDGQEYFNRKLAVSVLIVLFIHFPFI